IGAVILGNVTGPRLQRIVGRRVREIEKERLATLLFLVLPEKLDSFVSKCFGAVIVVRELILMRRIVCQKKFCIISPGAIALPFHSRFGLAFSREAWIQVVRGSISQAPVVVETKIE